MGDLRKNNSGITDFHSPTKHMKIQNNSPSWLNREIIEELYLKDDLYKRASFSGREEDWEIFRVQNKRIKKLILEAKEEYIKEFF